MATYMPLISAFVRRTCFWPPEAFTLDCRIEERIYEWCERDLKTNEEFMALVTSETPLDMETLWSQIFETAYEGLTTCIFHYWLILNWTRHMEGGTICKENADWIAERIKIKGRLPWSVGSAREEPVVAAGASQIHDPSICYTVGNLINVIKLSDVAMMDEAELKQTRLHIRMFCAESYSPEDCMDAETILEAVEQQLAR
jgi:hypothetical protein